MPPAKTPRTIRIMRTSRHMAAGLIGLTLPHATSETSAGGDSLGADRVDAQASLAGKLSLEVTDSLLGPVALPLELLGQWDDDLADDLPDSREDVRGDIR